MDKKTHKKRKKRQWHDIDAMIRFVWDDLVNIEKEINEILKVKK